MPIIHDDEFGDITVRRQARSAHIRMRVAPNGSLRISTPTYTPLFVVKRMIASSRQEIRDILSTARPVLAYENGSEIGKSHSLLVRTGSSLEVSRKGLHITVTLPDTMSLSDHEVQEQLRSQVIAALRREAKGYLPKRLDYLARQHGFSYQQVRFSHASGRWGSCSSAGTISLNIALMKLPFELIDYVIIHELAHTAHMNHSTEFWQLVEQHDPHYKTHRARLKHEIPAI